MIDKCAEPRVILISQWPNVKNAEYELIEKIRKTNFKIAVVDYLGFDVETGQCINNERLSLDYDFAISFHFDTPKFLNITTYLWVANPLEYMHLRHDYRDILMHHYRSYDDYLYNGSEYLKEHIKRILGQDWRESHMTFFASCAEKVISEPKLSKLNKKLFYCGINWERGSDAKGRAHGLLELLQQSNVADFYGPQELDGINTWIDFTSYKGEIPFDGISMSDVMKDYAAVLAVSSPAHIKSKTSSSRVFEGFAAGVPVISDKNEHVEKLFGDLVYYFDGNTCEEKSASIIEKLEEINNDPQRARDKVIKAQQLIKEKYSFDKCLLNILNLTRDRKKNSLDNTKGGPSLDVFLFHHDPAGRTLAKTSLFPNIENIHIAIENAENLGIQIKLKVLCFGSEQACHIEPIGQESHVVYITLEDVTSSIWDKYRLGEKVALLKAELDAEYVCFLTQKDFVHHDHFVKAMKFYDDKREQKLFISGFYSNDLKSSAPQSSGGIIRNNLPVTMYKWTQNSLAENELGQFVIPEALMKMIPAINLKCFDAILPIALQVEAESRCFKIHRLRFITLRVPSTSFHQHFEEFAIKQQNGFWSVHYELVSNYNHELNAFYDCYFESQFGVQVGDAIAGHNLLSSVQADPAIERVNNFILKLRPFYRNFIKFKNTILLNKAKWR